MNFQKNFEDISRIRVEDHHTLDDVLFRIGEKLSMCLHVDRVNVWIFRSNPNRIECLGDYDRRTGHFGKGIVLPENEIPSYFKHLASDEVILIEDVYQSDISIELRDGYCQQHGIISIMDIPVRIEGKLEGVLCFEDCKSSRIWTDEEQTFALAVSQIVSLTIENQKRKSYQKKLLQALDEKDTLLAEMHHRIKNNLTMLVSLLRIQSRHVTDPDALEVFADFENQMFSISKLHEQLYTRGEYLEVDLHAYLTDLLAVFRSSHPDFNLHYSGKSLNFNSDRAVTLGLIVNEIISNAIKYAKPDSDLPQMQIRLESDPEGILLRLSDNGKGIGIHVNDDDTFGLSLIKDLSEQMQAKMERSSSPQGTTYVLRLS